MSMRRWGFPSLLLAAGSALWLLLAGPSKLGIDNGAWRPARMVAVA